VGLSQLLVEPVFLLLPGTGDDTMFADFPYRCERSTKYRQQHVGISEFRTIRKISGLGMRRRHDYLSKQIRPTGVFDGIAVLLERKNLKASSSNHLSRLFSFNCFNSRGIILLTIPAAFALPRGNNRGR